MNFEYRDDRVTIVDDDGNDVTKNLFGVDGFVSDTEAQEYIDNLKTKLDDVSYTKKRTTIVPKCTTIDKLKNVYEYTGKIYLLYAINNSGYRSKNGFVKDCYDSGVVVFTDYNSAVQSAINRQMSYMLKEADMVNGKLKGQPKMFVGK